MAEHARVDHPSGGRGYPQEEKDFEAGDTFRKAFSLAFHGDSASLS